MSLVEADRVVFALGWSLVHFLWQGALIAGGLELALLALRERSAELRYSLRCAALVLMGAAPAITFWLLLPAGSSAGAALAGAGDSETVGVGRGEPWLIPIVVAWSIGAAALGARLLRDYLRIRRLQHSGAGRPLPAVWQVRFDALAEALGARAIARVVESASLVGPTVIGWLEPVVLIPARVLTGLTREQIEALIAHELAHVRRLDFAVNLVQSALEALLFYHPAVWWVSKGIRAEREFCCDDIAVRVTEDRVSYARALTTLESWRGAELAIGMSTVGGPLMHRIHRLIGTRPANARAGGPLLVFGALLAVSALAASAFGNAAAGSSAPRQDPERVRAIRQRIDELQARIDELRSMIGDLGGEHELDDAPEAHRSHARHHGGSLQLELGELPKVEEIHAHVREALKAHGLGAQSGAGSLRLELGELPKVEEIHEHVRKALEAHGVRARHADGASERAAGPRTGLRADRLH